MAKCNKKGYDRIDAMLILSRCKGKNSNRQERRVYHCTKCNSYHLTSMRKT